MKLTLPLAITNKIERFIHLLNSLINHLALVVKYVKEVNMIREQGDDIGKL